MVQSLAHNQTQALTEWQQSPESVLQAARNVHDALLSAVIITHLPPSRLSCLRTMQAPDSTSPCMHPDCKTLNCQGNKLYMLSTSPLKMRIKFPHHKNEHRWNRAVIEFDVPSELAEMLLLYLEGPRKALLQAELDAEEVCDTVFMDKRCRPFDASTLCLHWQNFMRSQGGPAMGPSRCRKIFVTERRSDDAAPGPSDRGAAMVMGHSDRQWTNWYDVRFHAKLAQHAVDAMKLWRSAMLHGAAPDQAVAITDAAITAATASVDAAAEVAVTHDALAHATAIDASITADTTCINDDDDDDEDTDADLNIVAKRRRRVIFTDSDCDSQPQPAVQHAAAQPVQHSDDAQQHATQAIELGQPAEMESDMSEFMSCSSGSDIEVDLELF